MSVLVETFLRRFTEFSGGYPLPRREVRICEVRKWSLDLAWPQKMICLEIEGGQWTGGRHVRPLGFQNDAEKYNAAVYKGWKLFRFTAGMINEKRYYLPLLRTLGVIVGGDEILKKEKE